MTDPYLTIEDLKARGWTLGMIRRLLGSHDHERWNNKLGHQVSKSIKLYLAPRVVQLETTEKFLHAQERARAHGALMLKALQTRQAWEARALARYDALCPPSVHPVRVEGSPADQKELWQLHLRDFYRWQRQHDRLLSGLSQTARGAAEHRLLERYRVGVCRAYGWLE